MLAPLTNWALATTSVELIGLTVERLTLEDVYLRLTGYRGRPGAVGRTDSMTARRQLAPQASAGSATCGSSAARSTTSSSTSG